MWGGERRGSGQGPGALRACFLLAWLRRGLILMQSGFRGMQHRARSAHLRF